MTFQVAGQRPQYRMEIYRSEAWVWATHHWLSAYGQTTSIASGWPVSRQSSDVLIATRDLSAQMAPTTPTFVPDSPGGGPICGSLRGPRARAGAAPSTSG